MRFCHPSFSAGTASMDVHANSPSPPFPHVLFPRVYVQILHHLLFHRYNSHGCTCEFALTSFFRRYSSRRCTCEFSITSFSACTVPVGVHASLHPPPFPHVRFPWTYMRILPHLLFRRYGFRWCTCEFSLASFFAGIVLVGVHVNSPSPPFRRYGFHGCTCGFALTSFSAGTVPTGVRANSPSPPVPQVLKPGTASCA